MKKIGENLDS